MGHPVPVHVTTHQPGGRRDGALYDILDLRVDPDYEPLDLRIATVNALEARVLDNAQAFDYALRERYLALVPLSEDPAERRDGIRATTVGGFRVRVTPVAGSDRFSLKDYLALGHKVTNAMREAMKRSRDWHRWTIKDTRGPKRADAVEPPS
jgi:hypothetical protein